MTGGKDRHFTFQEHDHSRKDRNDEGWHTAIQATLKAYAGILVASTREEKDRGDCGRAQPISDDGRGDRPHAGEPTDGAERVERGTERVQERDVHRERPERSRDGVDRLAAQWQGGATTPAVPTAVLGASTDGATRQPPVLTITERLKALAQRARSKCPDDCCENCYNKHCRVLLKTCCVCTGDINLKQR